MPVIIRSKGGGQYSVATPHGMKAKSTTHEKALAQMKLLNAVKHGMKPSKRK